MLLFNFILSNKYDNLKKRQMLLTIYLEIFMNFNYVSTQARRYFSENCGDPCLCKIALHVGILTVADLKYIQAGHLSSQLRSQILTWLRQNANAIGLTKIH